MLGLDCKFVVVGDFNVPGDNLHQHVSVPFHVSGNVLDQILSQNGDWSLQCLCSRSASLTTIPADVI